MSMKLGSLTFSDWVPDDYDLPLPQKFSAKVTTLSGLSFFSWGTIDVGQEISISWDVMSKTLFEQLSTLLVSDTELTWLPEDGYTYQVQLTSLDGTLVTTFDNAWRQKVSIKLIIISKEVIPLE